MDQRPVILTRTSSFTADQLFSRVPPDTHLEYEQLPFDHPIYVLYS
jgi:hypothetical protein